LRKKFRSLFRGTLLNRMPTDSVGEHAEVLEAISPDQPGRVRYRGTSWKAVSLTETFKAGQRVSIVEQDGITLVVTEPFDEDREIEQEEL
jgi:inner membrane protein